MTGSTRETTLLGWLENPRDGFGLYSHCDDGWQRWPYGELAARSRGVSSQLRRAELARGDIVALGDAEPVAFICALFGSLHAGATVVPLPSPEALGARYESHVARLVGTARPRFVVAHHDGGLPPLAAIAGRAGSAYLQLAADPESAVTIARAAEPALIQFTSGSSGSPRGVRITKANLEHNMTAINDWLSVRPGDSAASWLPVHHDMGLVGMLMTTICDQRSLWQMSPRQFLVDPMKWLECFGRRGASFAAAPGFAYGYIARRVQPAQLDGLDFAGWRSAIVGAERLDAEPLVDFVRLVRPHGFSPVALRPAYGLAEATLAVTGAPTSTPPNVVRLRPGPINPGEQAMFVPPLSITRHLKRGDGYDGRSLVSSGRPLPGMTVSVVDESGVDVSPGTVGEIVIRGPSVAAGYWINESSEAVTRFAGGILATGDAGFQIGDDLFVLGRTAESIKWRGRTIFVEDLESLVARGLGIPPSHCVVVSNQHTGIDSIAVVLEQPVESSVSEVTRLVRPQLGPGITVEVYLVDQGTIPRTTSGKPRRRRTWQMIHDAPARHARRINVRRGACRLARLTDELWRGGNHDQIVNAASGGHRRGPQEGRRE